MTVSRDLLAKYFGQDPRLIAQMESQFQTIDGIQATQQLNIAATETLREATYLTLSPNSELPNERVLTLGVGIGAADVDGKLILSVTDVAKTNGGHPVVFSTSGETNLSLPVTGYVVTRAAPELLSNKTIAAPKITGLADYADDTAAATGGVPATLKVRVV
jgi:hypothetical protein